MSPLQSLLEAWPLLILLQPIGSNYCFLYDRPPVMPFALLQGHPGFQMIHTRLDLDPLSMHIDSYPLGGLV